jgi:hypothetical protein
MPDSLRLLVRIRALQAQLWPRFVGAAGLARSSFLAPVPPKEGAKWPWLKFAASFNLLAGNGNHQLCTEAAHPSARAGHLRDRQPLVPARTTGRSMACAETPLYQVLPPAHLQRCLDLPGTFNTLRFAGIRCRTPKCIAKLRAKALLSRRTHSHAIPFSSSFYLASLFALAIPELRVNAARTQRGDLEIPPPRTSRRLAVSSTNASCSPQRLAFILDCSLTAAPCCPSAQSKQ